MSGFFDPLVQNPRTQNSKCFSCYRLGAKRPFYLALTRTEVVPRFLARELVWPFRSRVIVWCSSEPAHSVHRSCGRHIGHAGSVPDLGPSGKMDHLRRLSRRQRGIGAALDADHRPAEVAQYQSRRHWKSAPWSSRPSVQRSSRHLNRWAADRAASRTGDERCAAPHSLDVPRERQGR